MGKGGGGGDAPARVTWGCINDVQPNNQSPFSFDFNFKRLKPSPGEKITYYFSVYDNDGFNDDNYVHNDYIAGDGLYNDKASHASLGDDDFIHIDEASYSSDKSSSVIFNDVAVNTTLNDNGDTHARETRARVATNNIEH